jgi:hypothetical protein
MKKNLLVFFLIMTHTVFSQTSISKDSIYAFDRPSDRSKMGQALWGKGERQEFYIGDTLYTQTGYKFYFGQKIKIGAGSGNNGYFVNIIRVNGTNTDLMYVAPGQMDARILTGSQQSGLKGSIQTYNSNFDLSSVMQPKNAGKEFIVVNLKRSGNKKSGYSYMPVIAEPVDDGIIKSKSSVGNLGTERYFIQYENAVQTGEIFYPGKTPKSSSTQTVEVKLVQEKNLTSLADELKKLKELFDSGVLNKQEYDEAKKKILSKY